MTENELKRWTKKELIQLIKDLTEGQDFFTPDETA